MSNIRKEEQEVGDNFQAYEYEQYGVEYEPEDDENDDELSEKPFDADKIRIEQRMLSLKFLKDLMDDKQLILAPGFQRNKVWKERKRKSLLIESLMLRIPIPAFYFYEDENSILYVIDGLQRLSTIDEYMSDQFKLSHLQYLQDVCGHKFFSQLDTKYKSRINQTQLAVNVIDARTPSQVKYDIFRRINTGGVPLNAQEIRNSTSKQRTRDYLKKLVNSFEFIEATGGGVNDSRMAAQELVLRFLSFYRAYDFNTGILHYPKSDLELFLDEAYEYLTSMSESDLKEYEQAFLRAMKHASALFGEYAFRKIRHEDLIPGARKKLINKSLFSSVSVLLSQENMNSFILKEKKERILEALSDEIESNSMFETSLTMGTNSKKRVKINFEVTKKLLNEVLSND